MSGQQIGAAAGFVVGAVAGFFTGGAGWVLAAASLGSLVGGFAGGALDPPKTADIKGPRVNDLSVQTATYGAFMPRIYGTVALTGNVFWLENNQIKEVARTTRQGGKGMGGSKSKTTTYSYYGTFAIGLCEGPMAGIRRIWIGPKLYYDAGSSDIGTIIASNQKTQYFKIYLGDEAQSADTRMQATLGVANTPAYRGLAYIVFYDLPLADFGNSLVAAQVKVEILSSGGLSDSATLVSSTVLPGTPRDLSSSAYHMDAHGFIWIFLNQQTYGSPGNATVLRHGLSGVDINELDMTPAPSYLHFKGWADEPVTATADLAGTFLIQDKFGIIINSITDTGLGGFNANYYQRSGRQFLIVEEAAQALLYDVSGASLAQVLLTTPASTRGQMHAIFLGAVNYYAFSLANQLTAYDLNWVEIWNVDMTATSISVSASGGGDDVIIREDQNGYPLVKWLNNFWRIKPSGYNYIGQAAGMPISYEELGGHHYLEGLWIAYISATNEIAVVRLQDFSNNSVSLGDIVTAETLKSNLLTSGDIDATDLTSPVRGYRITSLSALRGGIEALQGAWPFDVIQSGYQIKCVPRAQASIATITADRLDARKAGSNPGVQITNAREMDSVLPGKVSIKYLNLAREYDQGEQYAQRLNTDSVNIRAIELALVLTDDEAAQKCEILLYLYWLERYDVAFTLPPDYNYLEPADVITVTTADAAYHLRLTQINYNSDGVLQCQAKYNNAATYTSTAIGESGLATGQTLTVAGPTAYALLDMPLLQDVYNSPGFAVAMTGYLSAWPGGVLYSSDDGGQEWTDLQAFTPPGSIGGYALTALTAHGGTVLDKSSTLQIKLYQGTLSSITEAQLFAGQNWFAYGMDGRWEIIAAQKCVLQGDGSYILSDFLRSQNGTEWASGLHAIGDTIVYLSSQTVDWIVTNAAAIGGAKIYRGITNDATIDSDSNKNFTYQAENLKPLSPVALTGDIHPSTFDWNLTWTRRSRLGAWRDLVDAPVSETSEAYSIDIFADGTYSTVKRTLTSAAPQAAYLSSDQTTDFGGNQSTLYLSIYQLSSVVGRGRPLISSITR